MAIRITVVGMGCRGRDWVREVKAAAPAFELVACVDVDANALQRVSAEFNISPAQCFTHVEEAFESGACEAAIIATPADTHAITCEAALARNLAVLIEKPFTMQLGEATRLVALAESNNIPLLVAQNYRYLRSFRNVKRLIDEGALGDVSMVICHYYRPFHTMADSLAKLSHSVLWGISVHHLDALRYVLGTEVTNVVADSFTAPWGRFPQGASMQLMLSMENQTRVSYSATYESTGHTLFEDGQEFYARFIGERATLHVFHRWLILWENGKLPRLVRRGKRDKTEERILLEQFERAVRHGEATEVSGRDNLQTVAVLEACVRSAAQGRSINPQVLLRDALHKSGLTVCCGRKID